MKLLLFLSEITIPLLIFCIVGYGLLNRQPVYEEFVEAFTTSVKILNTMQQKKTKIRMRAVSVIWRK